jgi:proteasome lid subunit RPN8/RPN11
VTVTIARAAYDAAIAHVQAAVPYEGVGLLAGPATFPLVGDRPDPLHLDRWVPLDNVTEFPRVRYEVEHVDLLLAHETLEDEGRYPWVVVHSHVRAAATPSGPDVEYARNPRQLHLIVALAGLHPAPMLWRLDPGLETREPTRKIPFQVVDQGGQGNPPTDLTHGVTGA